MSEALLTLDSDTGAPPPSRIGTPADCCGFVQRLIQNDIIRSTHRVRVKGMIDGNAPWSKSEQIAKGQGNNTNLNFRQGEAVINQYKGPYYDLWIEVPLIAKIQTAFGTAGERSQWGQIISEEFDRMVKKWKRWDFVCQFHQFQMLVFGIGPVYFHDDVDWRPDAAKYSDVLVEDGSPSNVSEQEGIVILKDYAPTRLYGYIHDAKVATDMGWNVGEVERGIIEAKYPGTGPNDQRALEWYQQKFKNADLFNGDGATVRTGHTLVSEFAQPGAETGKVSHHIVRSDQSRTSFMFSKLNAFPAMEDVIVPFFYDIGDGTWHSIRGLGYQIYPYIEVFNRLRCKEIDGAMTAACVLLKTTDSASVNKAQLLKIQNLGILPPGLDVVSSNIAQGIESTVQVRRDMEQGLNQNVGLMQKAPGTANPRKGQKQAIMEMQQTAALAKGNINRYTTSQDWLVEKMYWRAVRSQKLNPGGIEAKEFRDRCARRGVPPQALVEIDDIAACRSAGAGSAVNAIMATEALMEHIGQYPDAGKDYAVRLWIARMLGADTATAIMGDVKKPDDTQDDWEAAMENNALRDGGKGFVAERQSNVLHLNSHLGDAEQHIQETEQDAHQGGGMDIDKLTALSTHLEAAGPHCAAHLQALKPDESRKDDYAKLYKRFEVMSRLNDKVKQQLGEMHKALARQQPQPNGSNGDLPYDKVPESVKIQLEQDAGKPRQPGDLSVPAQKIIDTHVKTQLKARQQQQKGALDDVKMSRELQTAQ